MSGRNKSVGFAVLSIVLVLAAGLVVSGCGGGAAPKPGKIYKVTFEASGGEPVPEAQLVEAGSKIELPKAMARTKFTFSGWYKDLDCKEPWDFARDTVESDIILFANWKSAAGKSGGGGGGGSSPGGGGPSGGGGTTYFAVAFDGHGGLPATRTVNVASGTSLGSNIYPYPTNGAIPFFGWNTEPNGTGTAFTSKTAVTSSMAVAGKITLYAQWRPPEHSSQRNGSHDPGKAFLVSTPDALRFIGKGTSGYYYELWTLDKCYELNEDIDMTGEYFEPIGTESAPFTGVFDGNDHVIDNLTITVVSPPGTAGQGMFGSVGDDTYLPGVHPARVTGVTLVNCKIDSSSNPLAAGLVGKNYGTVEYCNVIDGTIDAISNAGGVVGYNWGIVQNCYAKANVTAIANVGGVVGFMSSAASMRNCYATGSVTADERVGGVVGGSVGLVENCYATGSVTTSDLAGGVVGENYGTVQNCVALNTSVTAPSNIGRVVGFNNSGTLINNYARDDLNPTGGWSLDPGGGSTVDGEGIPSTDWGSSSWWTTPANWDTAAWDAAIWDFSGVSASSYPVLRPPTP